jgi:hypothetical protein
MAILGIVSRFIEGSGGAPHERRRGYERYQYRIGEFWKTMSRIAGDKNGSKIGAIKEVDWSHST